MRLAQPIYIPDYMIVLLHIKDKKARTMTVIANDSETGYANIFKLKKAFLERGLINVNLVGLRHDITISDKGLKVVALIEQLMEQFNITMDDLKRMRQEIKFKHKKNKPDNVIEQAQEIIKEGEINGTDITY